MSTNMYIYCSNNPANISDPSGNWGIPALLSIVGTVFSAIAEAISAVIPPVAIGIAIVATGVLIYKGVQLYNDIKSKDESIPKLPNKGPVKGNIPGAPEVDFGSQKKHIPTHPGSIPEKSQWPTGEDGVDLTQEGWMKGKTVKKQPGEEFRVWDTGRVIGPNGETRVKVHKKEKTG